MTSGLSVSFPPLLLLPPNFAWLTWAIWGKEQDVYHGLCILQSITSTAWPLGLPGQRPLCLLQKGVISILSTLWALLYFPSCTQACRAEEHWEIQVGLYQLWVTVGSTYFPLETVLTAHLACLSVLRLYLGCCRVLEYKERTLRRWTW